LVTLFLIIPSFNKPLAQDEGVFLSIADGISNDRILYLDFFDHKPPGIYFLLATVLLFFGKNIFFIKIILLLFNILSAFFVFLFAEKIKKGIGLLGSFLFLFSLIFFEGNYIIAEPFMVTFILFSFYFLLKYFDSDKNYYLLLAGFTSGLALLFKQTAIVNLIIFLFFLLSEKRKSKDVFYYLLGVIIPWLFAFLYLIDKGALKESINQIIVLNFTSYPREPLQIVLNSFIETVNRTFPAWLFFIIYFFQKKSKNTVLKKMILFSIILPIPFFLVRHYPHYWIQILPFVAILSAAALYNFFNQRKNIIFKLIVFLIISLSVFGNYKLFVWITDNINIPKLKEQNSAKEFIDNLPNKKILTENQFTCFYFLIDKEKITKYLYITEVNDGEKAEPKTLESLKSNPDTYILWTEDLNFAYARKLQDYIIKNYKPIRKFDNLGLVVYEKP